MNVSNGTPERVTVNLGMSCNNLHMDHQYQYLENGSVKLPLYTTTSALKCWYPTTTPHSVTTQKTLTC